MFDDGNIAQYLGGDRRDCGSGQYYNRPDRGLVFKRIAPLDLVLDLAGGIVAVMNIKLRRWQQDLRDEQAQPSWGEWFEWLGDQAQKHKADSEPAHILYRDWAE